MSKILAMMDSPEDSELFFETEEIRVGQSWLQPKECIFHVVGKVDDERWNVICIDREVGIRMVVENAKFLLDQCLCLMDVEPPLH
jgi:hypothetical protein